MANEVVSGSGAGASVLVSEIARRVALLQLADRASLRNHPALVNVGEDLVGAGTVKGSILALGGVDEFVAATEIEDVGNTAIGSANFTVTPGRFALARGVSDYQRIVDPTGSFDPMALAQYMVMGYAMLFTTEIAKIGDGFTAVGTTGTEFTHDRFLLGQTALKQAHVGGGVGRPLFVMSTYSFSEWMLDLETRGGLTQWRAASVEMQTLRGTGYEGEYNGIDVFTTDRVQGLNTDADHGNFIFGSGAIGYKEVRPPRPSPNTDVILEAGPVRIESDRTASTTVDRVIGNAWAGFSVIEAARGRVVLGQQAA